MHAYTIWHKIMTALDRDDLTSMRRAHWNNLPSGGDLFGELHLAQTMVGTAPKGSLFPGLAACAVASAAAAWLSDHYGFPIILLGLLVGLTLNFISTNEATTAGSTSRRGPSCASGSLCWVAGDLPADRGARAGAVRRADRHHDADDGRRIYRRAHFGTITLWRAARGRRDGNLRRKRSTCALWRDREAAVIAGAIRADARRRLARERACDDHLSSVGRALRAQ